MAMDDEKDTTYLRQRRKKSLSLTLSISSCFHGQHHDNSSSDSASAPYCGGRMSPVPRSPSSWFRGKNNYELSDQKPKCRGFMSRMGRQGRRHSADFSYDPLSYALNFDDDNTHVDVDFVARLPVSPPRMRTLELPDPRRKGGARGAGSVGSRGDEKPAPAKAETAAAATGKEIPAEIL